MTYKEEANSLISTIEAQRLRLKRLIGLYIRTTFKRTEDDKYSIIRFSNETGYPVIRDLMNDTLETVVWMRASENTLEFNINECADDEGFDDAWFSEDDDYLIDLTELMGFLENAEREPDLLR